MRFNAFLFFWIKFNLDYRKEIKNYVSNPFLIHTWLIENLGYSIYNIISVLLVILLSAIVWKISLNKINRVIKFPLLVIIIIFSCTFLIVFLINATAEKPSNVTSKTCLTNSNYIAYSFVNRGIGPSSDN